MMENQVVEYNVNKAEIAKMSDIYMKLTIKDFDDEEGFEAVHTARMVMVKHRTAVDKLRKSANETAQKFVKNNNANAKKLTVLIEPIETHLKNEEDVVTKEKERIKAEEEAKEKAKIESRVSELFALGVNVSFFDVAMLSEAEYMVMLAKATEKYQDERERLEKEHAELERLRKKEEADRKAESERLEKLGREQAIEAERLAKIQADIDVKEKALKDAQDKLEADKKSEQARKDLEILEKKLAEKAKVKAEKDAIEKVEREAKKLKEWEEAETTEKARLLELAPDKEKLTLFADEIQYLREKVAETLTLKSKEAQSLYDHTINNISILETDFREGIKEL